MLKQFEVKNIYIGEYGWKPWENTLAYYEFNNNLNDSSGNGRNLSLYSWSVTYWTTEWWAKYWYFNTNTWTNNITYSSLNYATDKYTLAYWIQPKQKFSSWVYKVSVEMTSTSHTDIFIRTYNTIWFNEATSYEYNASANTWYLVVAVRDWITTKDYINWILVNTWTPEKTSWTKDIYFRLNNAENQNNTTYSNNQYFSEFIIENRAWTAEQALSYYNQTKSNYWL